jgi:hypothetical protein
VLRDEPFADGTFFQMLDGAVGAGAERFTQCHSQLQRNPPPHVVRNGVFGGHDGGIHGTLGGHFSPGNSEWTQHCWLAYRSLARKDEPVAKKSMQFH